MGIFIIKGETMKNIKRTHFIVMFIMAVISFSNLFGLKVSGASVVIGIIFFFVNKAYEKQPFEHSGLDMKAIGNDLRNKGIWFWFILPLIMDGVSIITAKIFLPEYIEHVLARTEIFISFDKVILMIFQLAILALGEEIAWRAFFQKQLNKAFSIIPVLLISSILFGLGHFSQGNAVIVVFDIFFVFINSILYGIIFYKSNNAWVSGISHFVANLFSIIILLFIL